MIEVFFIFRFSRHQVKNQCVCVRSAIPLSGAAHNHHGFTHIPVRRDNCELFDRLDRRTLCREHERERRRASVHVGHQRDRHRGSDRLQHDFLDDADAQRMPARFEM